MFEKKKKKVFTHAQEFKLFFKTFFTWGYLPDVSRGMWPGKRECEQGVYVYKILHPLTTHSIVKSGGGTKGCN